MRHQLGSPPDADPDVKGINTYCYAGRWGRSVWGLTGHCCDCHYPSPDTEEVPQYVYGDGMIIGIDCYDRLCPDCRGRRRGTKHREVHSRNYAEHLLFVALSLAWKVIGFLSADYVGTSKRISGKAEYEEASEVESDSGLRNVP